MGFDRKEADAVRKVLLRGELSGYKGNLSGMYGGIEIQWLEKEWAEYFNVKHAIAVNSNTSGLWCSLATLNLNPGDEVIVTPYSMTCSASLPLLFGATPVFADIEKDYFCLDPMSVEERITPRTKAILVVDLFGQPYNADAINEIATRYDLQVIEDAAQAPGAKYKGKYAGTLGDIGVFSLNYHKHIHCGEGGIIVTNNDFYAERIRLLMNHAEAIVNDVSRQGLKLKYTHNNLVGMNLRMTELSAAIARIQLRKLPDILKVYQEDARHFPVEVRPECEHVFYRYAFSSKDFNGNIPDGFASKRNYITPLYRLPVFRNLGYGTRECLTCEEVEEDIMLAWHEIAP